MALAESLGVSSCVTFLGYVHDQANVYKQFDLMVIPSRSEEGPISLFEAWAIGIPVVASDAPVLDERIVDGQTGRFFCSEDHVSLANTILELAHDKALRARLSENGLEQSHKYTFDRYHQSLYQLYSQLCR